jgi:hypothetical protein
MKAHTISAVTAVAVILAGCGKKSTSSGTTPTKELTMAASAATPVAQATMTAWQQGDKATAISSFLAAGWSVRPLFASDSTLSLTEDQFKSLSEADREAKSKDMMSQLGLLKQLAAAVAQAGIDSAAHGDSAQARKYLMSLEQFGTALNSPDYMKIVQLVGVGVKKRADAELAKIGQ